MNPFQRNKTVSILCLGAGVGLAFSQAARYAWTDALPSQLALGMAAGLVLYGILIADLSGPRDPPKPLSAEGRAAKAEIIRMYQNARMQFWTEVEPHITDASTRAFAESLAEAIGEISVDDAVTALLDFKRNRGV